MSILSRIPEFTDDNPNAIYVVHKWLVENDDRHFLEKISLFQNRRAACDSLLPHVSHYSKMKLGRYLESSQVNFSFWDADRTLYTIRVCCVQGVLVDT